MSAPFSSLYPPRRPGASPGTRAEGAASHPPRSPCSDSNTEEPTNTMANKKSERGHTGVGFIERWGQMQNPIAVPACSSLEHFVFCLHDYQIVAARRRSNKKARQGLKIRNAHNYSHKLPVVRIRICLPSFDWYYLNNQGASKAFVSHLDGLHHFPGQ